MRNQQTDLWTTPCDAVCVTTNGTIKMNGEGVMGRGCAKPAVERLPGIARALGAHLRNYGNHAGCIASTPRWVFAFPVKHMWDQRADPKLIARSAEELMRIVDAHQWQTVLLPRPGCGNGQLAWAEVEPVVAPILDDRVVVVWL